MPVPTTDTEPESEPDADNEPEGPSEPYPTLEPEPKGMSDQVCKPTTPPTREGVLVEFAGMDGSPAHTPTPVNDLCLASGNTLDEFEEVIPLSLPSPLVPSSSEFPVSPLESSSKSTEIPHSLPFPLPLPKPASSPAHHRWFLSVPWLILSRLPAV